MVRYKLTKGVGAQIRFFLLKKLFFVLFFYISSSLREYAVFQYSETGDVTLFTLIQPIYWNKEVDFNKSTKFKIKSDGYFILRKYVIIYQHNF